MIPDILVETVVAVITTREGKYHSTERVPLKWLLKQQDYAGLLVQIRFGYEDLIESIDKLDGFGKTADG